MARSAPKKVTKAAAPKVSRPTRETVALAWVIGAIAIEVLAYSTLFGGLGRVIREGLSDLFGPSAWFAVALQGMIGVAELFGQVRKGRRIWALALSLCVSALVGLVLVTHASSLKLIGPSHGGVLGDALALGLGVIAGTVGARILASVGVVVAFAAVLGVRFSMVAKRLSERLSSRTANEKPARVSAPRRRVIEAPIADDVVEDEPAGKSHTGEELALFEPQFHEVPVVPDPDVQSTITTADRGWTLPKATLLSKGTRGKIDRTELLRRGQVLTGALASHGVEIAVIGMTVGPTVTRYEVELGEGVKVARVLALQRDIAYAMAAVDVRILAPIPGRSAVGIEVPNRVREVVTLGDVLATDAMRRASHILDVPLGRDISGATSVMDLATMPHVLVAGSTGSGKSSLINSLLTALLMRNTPEELRLILVDPKRVELSQYNGLPHLLTEVVVDPKKASNALAWAVEEMEKRYDTLARWGVRDIVGYRELVSSGVASEEEDPPGHLPYILVVIDELNDLMMAAPRDVEDAICRIAQKARAVGIHLVVATQRPSVNVITGVIKTNIPSRIAFAVASQTDSRVILDAPGAEKLVGKGDLLFVTASTSHPQRLQSAWVSEKEVASVVGHWRRQGQANYIEALSAPLEGSGRSSAVGGSGDDDVLLEAAARLVVETGQGSTSMLQRRLKVGFARAGRLMDLLEARGIVGPPEGSKQRQVLVTPEEYEELSF